MVQTLLSLPEPPRPDHAADALAVAICHANRAPLAAAVAGMIALVAGEVAVRRPDHVVVACGGVGYRLAVSAETLRHVPRVGKPSLHTHLVVRDDALLLYGFATEEERDLFLLLLGVQSVGPKVALAVLSGGPPRELIGAIAAGDVARLQAVPGIGKRTAERIIVELREKVGGAPDEPIAITRGDDPRLLAREGLLGLGFSPAEADELLDGAPGDTPEELIAHALGARGGDPRPRRRIQTPDALPEDDFERTLRPRPLDEFVGQDAVKEQLAVAIEAAAARGEALDHVLLAGPPGLGKTSLAQIVATELGVPFVQTAGPALERKGDVAAFLTALEPRSVFFVDEIHRLPRALEETFYPAMEDRQLPITVGQGAGARVVTLDLPPFTLIGATTRAGLLTTPLRDRFGIQHRLEHYDPDDLAAIVTRSAASSASGSTRRRARDRRAQPRHAARGQPAAQARARLRRGARRRRITRRSPTRRSTCSRSTSEGLDRLDREILARDLRAVRRRPGRAVDARGRGGGGAGHDRGRLRALPAPARPAPAHAARAQRDGARVAAPRPRAAGRATPRSSDRALTRRGVSACRPWRTSSSAPTAGSARPRTDRPPAFAAPKGCAKCGFAFLFELLDDYYPAPDAAFFVCDQEGRVIGCGRGSFELTGLTRRGSSAARCATCSGSLRRRRRPRRHGAGVGRARARQGGRGQRRGRSARPGHRRPVPRLRRRRRAAGRADALQVARATHHPGS